MDKPRVVRKCLSCSHEWFSRLENPACSNCHVKNSVVKDSAVRPEILINPMVDIEIKSKSGVDPAFENDGELPVSQVEKEQGPIVTGRSGKRGKSAVDVLTQINGGRL